MYNNCTQPRTCSICLTCAYFLLNALLNGCSSTSSKPYFPRDVEELVISLPAHDFPESLHPTLGLSRPVLQKLHLTLTDWDLQGNQQPLVLAKPYEVRDDGREFVFVLREDLFWDDGSPLSIEDVVFSLKILVNPVLTDPHVSAYFRKITEVKVSTEEISTLHVKLVPHLENPLIPNYWVVLSREQYDPSNILGDITIDQMRTPTQLASDTAFVAWAHQFVNDGVSMADSIQFFPGAGPFFVKSWKPGQSLQLVRKDSVLNRGLINEKDLLIKKIKYKREQVLADVLSQNVDVVANITPRIYDQLVRDSVERTYHMDLIPGEVYTMVSFNLRPNELTGSSILLDIELRKALEYLFPVNEMIRSEYGSLRFADRLTIPIRLEEGFLENDSLFQPVNFNPAKARELLTKAGWKDENNNQILEKELEEGVQELSFSLVYENSNDVHRMIATFIEEECRAVGIDCRPLPTESAAFQSQVDDRFYDMIIVDRSFKDIASEMNANWKRSDWLQGGGNLSGFGDDETDAWIDSLGLVLDSEEKAMLIQRFWEEFYKRRHSLGLFAPRKGVAIHRRLDTTEWKQSRLVKEMELGL